MRREHLRRLHRIYEDRRQVNLEAISVLVGAPPCAAAAAIPPPLCSNSYWMCLSSTASAAGFAALHWHHTVDTFSNIMTVTWRC